MLRVVWPAPVSEDEHDELVLEASSLPVMTSELAAALARLLREALARRARRSERAA
jgi:hypothetical protein